MKSSAFLLKPAPLMLALLLSACGSTQKTTTQAETNAPKAEAGQSAQSAPKPPAAPAAPAVPAAPAAPVQVEQGVIYVLNDIPYNPDKTIDEKVENECVQLGRQFSDSLVKYANGQKLKVKRVESLPEEGAVVKLTIDNVFSEGHAGVPFNGHQKSVTVTAHYWLNGKEVDSKEFSRNSTGGFWGGFKGSCSVLQHTVNTLGNDVAKWLKTQA
ncbi:hypothetical protein JYB88_13900 [Shewanella cyperi]|uniref:Lipoprotein n=1 Tax=Shewanella cyperi TaxID=2814292 RepID=A0A975AJP3_9GAMM|nr:hypothetical protein [Shewanella cyperi]QSX29295.1 hypothetical protein JYB88_13900 [Shewanella cyperi]